MVDFNFQQTILCRAIQLKDEEDMKTAEKEEEEKNMEISEVIRAAPDQNEGKDTKAAEEETAEKAATAQAAEQWRRRSNSSSRKINSTSTVAGA